uniref:Uncharacterized protein n=1 Tax=Anopheles atroparvus TaxID=41427 RepID=A0A182J2N9_ANOAO
MYNKMSSFESASSEGGDLCQRVCDPDPYYETNGVYYTQLYPADSQNPGGTPVSGHGGHGVLLEEEGYWGSPCSSSESQPDPATHRDRYTTPPPLAPPLTSSSTALGHTTLGLVGSTGVLGRAGLRHMPSSSVQPADQSSYSSAVSCSSSSSSSSSSASPSTSSSPYGALPTAGYHQQQRHLAHDGQHHHQHHHHHQTPPSMYCSMVYDKGAAYVPDEGYYGGNGTSMDIVSGTGGDDHAVHLHTDPSSTGVIAGNGLPVVRVVKRRNTANKKERRRTQSINSAYSSLRDRIPNVPNDTKLSKIKTLRLAISYIAHLLAVVNGNQDPSCDFRAELVPSSRKINAERRAQKTLMQNLSTNSDISTGGRKVKGRTGWPQHVWALETKTTIK